MSTVSTRLPGCCSRSGTRIDSQSQKGPRVAGGAGSQLPCPPVPSLPPHLAPHSGQPSFKHSSQCVLKGRFLKSLFCCCETGFTRITCSAKSHADGGVGRTEPPRGSKALRTRRRGKTDEDADNDTPGNNGPSTSVLLLLHLRRCRQYVQTYPLRDSLGTL